MDFYVPHPYGVIPLGNAPADFQAAIPARLGTLLCRVALTSPDQEPSDLLLGWLDAEGLAQLGATSTAWFALVNGSEDVWRGLVVAHATSPGSSHHNRPVSYVRSWRDTATAMHVGHTRFAPHTPVKFPGRPWCSARMFQAWLCTVLPPDYKMLDRGTAKARGVVKDKSAWCAAPKFSDVPRVAGLTPETFREQFEGPNRPVILPDVARKWRLFELLDTDFAALSHKQDDILRSDSQREPAVFRCEAMLFTLEAYVAYAAAQQDERPAYLFDADFMNVFRPGLWAVPEHFGRDDLFAAFGTDRPNYRWLIAGPKRAGSSFHIDPNYTNAWNTCLTGRKRWILFPPDVVPPGVFPSKDMSDVTTPVSLTEWLLNYYEHARHEHHRVGFECVCEAGETMFVPCGWWHCVINLDDSVALTQNYVSAANLPKVLRFLRAMPGSISGIGEEDASDVEALQTRRQRFYLEFAEKMREYRSDLQPLVDDTLRTLDEEIATREEARKRPRAADLLGLKGPGRDQPSAEVGGGKETEDSMDFTFDF